MQPFWRLKVLVVNAASLAFKGFSSECSLFEGQRLHSLPRPLKAKEAAFTTKTFKGQRGCIHHKDLQRPKRPHSPQRPKRPHSPQRPKRLHSLQRPKRPACKTRVKNRDTPCCYRWSKGANQNLGVEYPAVECCGDISVPFSSWIGRPVFGLYHRTGDIFIISWHHSTPRHGSNVVFFSDCCSLQHLQLSLPKPVVLPALTFIHHCDKWRQTFSTMLL